MLYHVILQYGSQREAPRFRIDRDLEEYPLPGSRLKTHYSPLPHRADWCWLPKVWLLLPIAGGAHRHRKALEVDRRHRLPQLQEFHQRSSPLFTNIHEL